MIGNVPSQKKIPFKIQPALSTYLIKYGRAIKLPLQYEDLLRYEMSMPVIGYDGHDTLWQTVHYKEFDQHEIHEALTEIYSMLKTDGDKEVLKYLEVARIDYCTFGNTRPFRVRIINRLNDNYDHFYVKRADASRIYGLELEHITSPNNINYLVEDKTLIEEHVAGIPGDQFIENNLADTKFNQIRFAKEFIKFNERCFVRLLGDMRSYNYVVDITPDIEGSQFRIRPIDFDQQSYEGWKSFYLPQYFKENNPIVFMGMQLLQPENVRQYQLEERSMIAARIKTAHPRIDDLLEVMTQDTLASLKKVVQLREDLATHHSDPVFLTCTTMGEIVLRNIQLVLQKVFKQSM
jgi:hypothetical protein